MKVRWNSYRKFVQVNTFPCIGSHSAPCLFLLWVLSQNTLEKHQHSTILARRTVQHAISQVSKVSARHSSSPSVASPVLLVLETGPRIRKLYLGASSRTKCRAHYENRRLNYCIHDAWQRWGRDSVGLRNAVQACPPPPWIFRSTRLLDLTPSCSVFAGWCNTETQGSA